MAIVKQALALYLVLTALAVAVLLMITGLIHDGSEDYPLWEIMNRFMAAGVVVCLVTNFLHKRRQDAGEASSSDLGVSLVFYGAIVLTMLFFWEWFWTLNPGSETGEAVTSHMVYFPLMDSLYVVISLTTGRDLWRTARE